MDNPNSKTKSFRDLVVWQKSYTAALQTYELTANFPKNELYGLAQQIRRAAISIPSNIAEGYNRKHNAEYKQFLSVAYGSLSELQTQYLLSVDLKYTKPNSEYYHLLDEIGAMLYCMLYPKQQ
jgi:four helix bundle protein